MFGSTFVTIFPYSSTTMKTLAVLLIGVVACACAFKPPMYMPMVKGRLLYFITYRSFIRACTRITNALKNKFSSTG